jgi:hypothetical protein
VVLINPPLSDLVADFAGASIKTFLRQRRKVFFGLPVNSSQLKRMAWKRVVDIIPSNFLQTRMLSDDEYPIPQREALIRIIRNRRIQRCVPYNAC